MSTTVGVWFDALRIGDIRVAEDGEVDFAYTPAWLATRGAFPMSHSLPLEARRFPADVVTPWLAHLLPEEHQLGGLARALGLDRTETLGILQAIGGDTAGALSFGDPPDRSRQGYTKLTSMYGADDPEIALAQHFADLAKRPLLVGEDGVRISLAGGQTKSALAVLDRTGAPVLRLPSPGDVLAVPRRGAPSTVILKPDNQHLPGIVENETYCLTLAAAVGIKAAEVALVRAGARKAICVLRYDRRIGADGNLQRVHQEDFAQANGVPPGRKYERGVLRGPGFAVLLGTGRLLPPTDALALLDQVIFNILVSNTDAHAKNYSVLLPINENARLAPLYDVSTALPWPEVVQYFAQNIASKKRKPGDLSGDHWDWIARTGGYRPADVRKRVRALVDNMVQARLDVARTVCGYRGCAAGYVEDAAQRIEENALRIAGRLSSA